MEAYQRQHFLERGPYYCLAYNIFFCFQSNLDQTWSDCSTHEYLNLTKFGQNWTKYKKNLSLCKILARPHPFLNCIDSSIENVLKREYLLFSSFIFWPSISRVNFEHLIQLHQVIFLKSRLKKPVQFSIFVHF